MVVFPVLPDTVTLALPPALISTLSVEAVPAEVMAILLPVVEDIAADKEEANVVNEAVVPVREPVIAVLPVIDAAPFTTSVPPTFAFSFTPRPPNVVIAPVSSSVDAVLAVFVIVPVIAVLPVIDAVPATTSVPPTFAFSFTPKPPAVMIAPVSLLVDSVASV
jgi:hypothetical protein